MNKMIARLPKVLQNEIWEYVRGDRAYHRQLFGQVVDQLDEIIEETEIDLYCHQIQWTKAKRLKFHSNFRRDGGWKVKEFIKHQHQNGGILFADSKEDLDQKAYEWLLWFDAPELI